MLTTVCILQTNLNNCIFDFKRGKGCAIEGIPGVYGKVQTVLPWIYGTICTADTSVFSTDFCTKGVADLNSNSSNYAVMKSCTSIGGKFALEGRNGKIRHKTCNWKGVKGHCTSTVTVDDKKFLLDEVCPIECSASWCE